MTIQNITGLMIIDKISCMDSNRYSAAVIYRDNIIINKDDYPEGAKAVLVFCGSNDQDSGAGSVEMKDKNGVDVTGAEVFLSSVTWPKFDIAASEPFEIPSGNNAYYFVLNNADDVLSKVEVYIVMEY